MEIFSAEEAWSVLSPEASDAIDFPRWMNAARVHFGAELSRFDAERAGEVRVGVAPARAVGRVTIVRVRSAPVGDAPGVMHAANAGARAIGGAGMDALVARAKRVWQAGRMMEGEGEGDAGAPLVLAAVWASVMLGPVVPPDEVTVFGVRGARLRLEGMGWR